MINDARQHYSVLMSVYDKEQEAYLQRSMESIFYQTVPTDDFVLVCDGQLTLELNRVIAKMQEKHSDVLHVIHLEQNMGLGKALNYGLKQCKNELVARMDSDDISRPERCEKQLKIFENNPELAIVSATVEEFADMPEQVTSRRILPEMQKDIIEFAKKRSPFNHPCAMYKKSAVESVGGYQDFYLLEDYYLWIRMLWGGCKGYNLQEPLLWMRAGNEMYKRRAGLSYAKSQRMLFGYMREKGFITWCQYAEACIVRSIFSLLPNWLRKWLFINVLRM